METKKIEFKGICFLEDKEAREFIIRLDNKFSMLNEKVKSLGRDFRELKKETKHKR